jgi:2-methylcitrate dehydratase PrpD
MSDPAENASRRRRHKIQRQLDEALEASFPASDPVSIVTSHEEEDWGDDDTPAECHPGPPERKES